MQNQFEQVLFSCIEQILQAKYQRTSFVNELQCFYQSPQQQPGYHVKLEESVEIVYKKGLAGNIDHQHLNFFLKELYDLRMISYDKYCQLTGIIDNKLDYSKEYFMMEESMQVEEVVQQHTDKVVTLEQFLQSTKLENQHQILKLKCTKRPPHLDLENISCFYVTFKDQTNYIECIFLRSIIKDKDLMIKYYNEFQIQQTYEFKDIVVYGQKHNQKLKFTHETKFKSLDTYNIIENYSNILQDAVVKEEELDIIGVVTDCHQINLRQQTIQITTGTIDNQKQAVLNLWDSFQSLKIKSSQIIVAETLLLKKYQNQLELNTTKDQTKIYLDQHELPERFKQPWLEMVKLQSSLQIPVQPPKFQSNILISSPIEGKTHLNIICKINQIGQVQQNQKFGFNVAAALITEAKTMKQYSLQLFNQLIEQVNVNQIYLITNVSLNERYPNEIKTWSNKTEIFDITNIDDQGEISLLVKTLKNELIHQQQLTASAKKIKQINITPIISISQYARDAEYSILAIVETIGNRKDAQSKGIPTQTLIIKVSDQTWQNMTIFLWDDFSKIDWQIGEIYLFERLFYKATYDQLKSGWQTSITPSKDIQEASIIAQAQAIKTYFDSIKGQDNLHILPIVPSTNQRKQFDALKMSYFDLNEIFDKSRTSKTIQIFKTKAFIVDISILGIKLNCSNCDANENTYDRQLQVQCPNCQKNANINVNIQAQISDATRNLSVTISDNNLELLSNNSLILKEIDKQEVINIYSIFMQDKNQAVMLFNKIFQKELLYQEFQMKIKYNPLKDINFSFLVQHIEQINNIENIELCLFKLMN